MVQASPQTHEDQSRRMLCRRAVLTFLLGCRKKRCNKRGCLQTHTNANKGAQTQTNADLRLPDLGPKTRTNAHKPKETQTNADKRKIEELQPLYAPLFCGSPISARG